MNLSQNISILKKPLYYSLPSQIKNNSSFINNVKTNFKINSFKSNNVKNTDISYSQDDSMKLQSTIKVKKTINVNNDYVLKLIKTNCPDILNPKINSKEINKNDINLKSLEIKKPKKDEVQSYFNRNFYSCEVPVPKKVIENQKILDYYIKNNEIKEKYKQLLKINRNKIINERKIKSTKNINSKKIIKNYIVKNKIKTKNNIKKSLMLNDFQIYDKIHRVVRFWGKFIDYTYPLFKVEKFKLNGAKYRNKSDNSNNKKEENEHDKNKTKNTYIKLPNLYTNSSKIFKRSEIYYNNHSNNFNRRNLSCSNIYS